MIINPYKDRERLKTFVGTNLIKDDFGLTGYYFQDCLEPDRWWCIEAFYRSEEHSRTGVRAQVCDGKAFRSFVLQHDLEVLLGMYKPGQRSPWSGQTYGEPGEHDFQGLQADSDDLEDHLYGLELVLRGLYAPQYRGGLPSNAEIKRRVHLAHKEDYEELHVLVRDDDPDTGVRPDYLQRHVAGRWKLVERTAVSWKSL